MLKQIIRKSILLGSVCAAGLATGALGEEFNIPAGNLNAALNAYSRQTGIPLIVSADMVRGASTRGVAGNLSPDEALTRILSGTGFSVYRDPAGALGIGRGKQSSDASDIRLQPMQLAQAAPPRAAVETVTVTSSKLGGADVQSIPIAITALSQEQLTSRQVAGGPDLVKQVPNLTFSKTNFTGYNIQIRGIGTQAISVTTDPAVAVALNDIPFIRNHFFEQEFFDLSQAEVLRGPQGTLYGRNATAGVVNLVTAKPTDQFEAMASGEIGNYKNRRFEGMINIPIDADRLDLRVAGEWTKRDGYTTNGITGNPVDGRDLWSTRLTLGWHPSQSVQAYLVWEHFQESDDRMRTQKQLCKTDPGLSSITDSSGNVLHIPNPGDPGLTAGPYAAFAITTGYLSQGCLPASLYSPQSFGVPNGFSLPYVVAGWVSDSMRVTNPYATTAQSRNLRVIETQIDPRYRAKNDTIEANIDYNVTPALTFSSQTGFNQDFLWSTEDYNRFNTAPDVFVVNNSNIRTASLVQPDGNYACSDGTVSIGGDNCFATGHGTGRPAGYFCDPQLGCSSRLVVQDVSREHAWQLSQEFRLASSFNGPFNFSLGANYMHYETAEDYFVFGNPLTLFAATYSSGALFANSPWVPNGSDNHECFENGNAPAGGGHGYQYNDPNLGAGVPTQACYYIDPNHLTSVNSEGHNYFVSSNPYVLNSYAGFGEAYYNILPDLKLTGGIRWTSDHKHFIDIPSELLSTGYGYTSTGAVNQQWNQLTGRLAANWSPKLDFTDQTLIYGSWAHGYKAGGANPPGAVLFAYGAGVQGVPIHPLTFKPEFVDAYELGTKNTLLNGGMTLNGDVFFYNYTGYQISRIVDRTALNDNFNATVKGAELEASYEPIPGLKFNFAGGYEHTRIKNGQSSVDLMDRTAGHPDWVVMKAFVTQPSNCIFPEYVVAALIKGYGGPYLGNQAVSSCGDYGTHLDPLTQNPYKANPVFGTSDYASSSAIFNPGPYPGFNPDDPALNGGTGFAKNLGGNELPNAPRFTLSASVDYSVPLTAEWAGTLHVDYYWQDYSWARVFNDRPYDRLRGYTNVNLALILTDQDGWQVMGYLKNVFNTTDITGAFLNSDDSGLTTNVFLTDPRLFGVRVTKNW